MGLETEKKHQELGQLAIAARNGFTDCCGQKKADFVSALVAVKLRRL